MRMFNATVHKYQSMTDNYALRTLNLAMLRSRALDALRVLVTQYPQMTLLRGKVEDMDHIYCQDGWSKQPLDFFKVFIRGVMPGLPAHNDKSVLDPRVNVYGTKYATEALTVYIEAE